MQRTGQNKVLGIAIGDRSLLIAEVSSGGGVTQVLRTGEFPFPAGMTLQQPEPLGQALLHFLKQHQFAARTAIFGVPAKWVLTKRKEVPAAAEQLVTETLRLQAEGEFSSEFNDLLYDYSGQASPAEARPVLLLGIPRRYVDQINALAESSRLRVRTITPYAAALGAVTSRVSKDATVLLLGPSGAEFASQYGSNPRALRYLGPAGPALLLAGEVRRNLALLPQNGDSTNNGHARPELTIWNDAGLDEVSLRSISEALEGVVKPGDLRSLGVTSATSGEGRDYGTAVALAMTGLEDGPPPVDFLHSRLAPPRKQSARQKFTLGALVGLLVLAMGIFAWVNLQQHQNEAARLTADLNGKQKLIDDATATVKKVEFARAWHTGNPKYLAFLRDLTVAVPEDGQLYLTSLDLKEISKDPKDVPAAKDVLPPLKGSLSGKASRSDSALKLFDKLLADKHFTNVETSGLDQRDVNRNNREVSFTCNFNYIP